MSQAPNIPALSFLKPEIRAGQTLWMSDGKFLNTRHLNRYPVLVTHAFVGQDDRTYCVLEIKDCQLAGQNKNTIPPMPGLVPAPRPIQYRLVPALALAPAQEGPDFLSLMIDPPHTSKPTLSGDFKSI